MRKGKQEIINLKIQTKRKQLKFKEQIDKFWIIRIILISFILSLTFAIISEIIIPNVPLLFGILVLILFIILGIIFDIIGVAVTASDIVPFNSMASRKVKGANVAVKLKKNADKVSSFCNDVIGDICGVISGSVGIIIADSISKNTNLNSFFMYLLVTALIASFTIGIKAISKSYAINNANIILFRFAKSLSIFIREKY